MTNDPKVLPFRSRPTKQKPGTASRDTLNMVGIMENVAKTMGLEDLPMQQALRLRLGLNGIHNCRPTQTMIAEQSQIISSWSPEERMRRAKESTEQDWKLHPALYTALADALSAME